MKPNFIKADISDFLKSKVFGICLLCFGLLAVTGFKQDDLYFSIKKNLKIFGAVYEALSIGYVDPVDPEKFLRGGMESMLEDLDPYTKFYDESVHTDIEIKQQGDLAGIGLTMGLRDGRLTILDVLPGYNSFSAGLRVGDTIVEIDGRSTKGLTPKDASVLLQGDAGSIVDLTIQMSGHKTPLPFKVERSRTSRTTVAYSGLLAKSDIAYLKLERFGAFSYKEMKGQLAQLQKDNELKGVVIDFRGNPGGLLGAAVDIVSLFVPREELVVTTRGRSPESANDLRSRLNPVSLELPLVILMDSVSASASEVVAGAIQDLDRGVIIGETSFGKGLVQNQRRMPYNTSLNVTVAKYYSPSGRCIQAVTYGEGGARISIPDSLRSNFRTRGGRLVRDGGGIEPDIFIDRRELSDTEEILEQNSAYKLFAANFASTNTTLKDDFEADDNIFDDFTKWVNAQNYQLDRKAKGLTQELELLLRKKNYSSSLKELEKLNKAISQEIAGDLQRNETRIKKNLKQAIFARYHPKEKLVELSLTGDEEIDMAVDVIKDSSRYKELLGQK